jgi:hypothetical protein
MQALFLVSHSMNCENFWRSWICTGNVCHVERYDIYSHDRQSEIVALVELLKPEIVIYVGAVEQYYNRPVPSVDILKRIHDLAPTILICCDAGDDYWWDWLIRYDREQCFSAQVSIDGNLNTPLAGFTNGIVKLTPTDPELFVPMAWDSRPTFLGMAGEDGGHAERIAFVHVLIDHAQLDRRHGMSPHDMGRFLGGCKIVPNHPIMGTGRGMHVKGRVIEAGWAGACCLEKANACTAKWFPDDLYLQYQDPGDALQKIAWARGNDDALRDMAGRFHAHVTEHHHPRVFWRDVLAKVQDLNARSLDHHPVDLPA